VTSVARIFTAATPLGAVLNAGILGVQILAPKASSFVAVVLNLAQPGASVMEALKQTAQVVASEIDPRVGAAMGLFSDGGFGGSDMSGLEFVSNVAQQGSRVMILVKQHEVANLLSDLSTMSFDCSSLGRMMSEHERFFSFGSEEIIPHSESEEMLNTILNNPAYYPSESPLSGESAFTLSFIENEPLRMVSPTLRTHHDTNFDFYRHSTRLNQLVDPYYNSAFAPLKSGVQIIDSTQLQKLDDSRLARMTSLEKHYYNFGSTLAGRYDSFAARSLASRTTLVQNLSERARVSFLLNEVSYRVHQRFGNESSATVWREELLAMRERARGTPYERYFDFRNDSPGRVVWSSWDQCILRQEIDEKTLFLGGGHGTAGFRDWGQNLHSFFPMLYQE